MNDVGPTCIGYGVNNFVRTSPTNYVAVGNPALCGLRMGWGKSDEHNRNGRRDKGYQRIPFIHTAAFTTSVVVMKVTRRGSKRRMVDRKSNQKMSALRWKLWKSEPKKKIMRENRVIIVLCWSWPHQNANYIMVRSISTCVIGFPTHFTYLGVIACQVMVGCTYCSRSRFDFLQCRVSNFQRLIFLFHWGFGSARKILSNRSIRIMSCRYKLQVMYCTAKNR